MLWGGPRRTGVLWFTVHRRERGDDNALNVVVGGGFDDVNRAADVELVYILALFDTFSTLAWAA